MLVNCSADLQRTIAEIHGNLHVSNEMHQQIKLNHGKLHVLKRKEDYKISALKNETLRLKIE